MGEQLKQVKATWYGPGLYWFNGQSGFLSLGRCETPDEMVRMIVVCVLTGGSDKDWSGWFTDKEE
jgi:hypothetical protein